MNGRMPDRVKLPERLGLCPDCAAEFYYPLAPDEDTTCPTPDCGLDMVVYTKVPGPGGGGRGDEAIIARTLRLSEGEAVGALRSAYDAMLHRPVDSERFRASIREIEQVLLRLGVDAI